MKKYSILITIIIFVFFIPITVNAASVKTGTFKYMPAFEDEAEERYYYSDDYFKQSGKIYNEHLLSMSYNLAISTFEVRNYTYSRDLLNEIGFKDIEAIEMEEKPTIDTIGTVIAHKEIDGHNVIAVAIRGEKYDSEWGNNFIVGKSGDAKGFSDTSTKVIARIKKYIQDNNLDNIKIWMTGYSRAGTIADLIGVYINKNLDEFKTTVDDLYIYTYETPSASMEKTIYDNIYVVINKNDMLPAVYPKQWGFHTNGKLITIGEDNTMTTYKGSAEIEEYGSINQSDFLNEFFEWLTSRLSRETYSENLEQPISEILCMVFNKSNSDREKLIKFFTEDVKEALLDNPQNKGMLKYKIWGVLGHNSDYLYQDVTNSILEIVDDVKATSENGAVLNDQEYQSIRNYLYPILRTIGPILVDDSNYYEGIDYDNYYEKYASDYYLEDEEMGKKYGIENGNMCGYDDGFDGNEKNEHPSDVSEYGPIYDTAYNKAYAEAYLQNYELGKFHKNNLIEKAKYDASKHAKSDGYYAGNHHNERNPVDECFVKNDWMTPEYISAYNEEYERLYNEGYDEGMNKPEEDEDNSDLITPIELYHTVSLVKNIKQIISVHYPQNNISLIHKLDSYYAPYCLTEGDNQIITINNNYDNNSLTVKTSGQLEKLVKVQVDENDVDEDNYILENGSTIVTLKDSYLKTLENGEHKLGLIYIDNTIETNFTIEGNTIEQNEEKKSTENKEKNSNETINTRNAGNLQNPQTGDDISKTICLFFVSIIGSIILLLIIKKPINEIK